jgi:hypothetical protein
MKKQQNEVSRQLAEIWEEHHNPEARDKKRILKNREKKREMIKKDLGI